MSNSVAAATYWICGASPVLSNTESQYKGDALLVQFEAEKPEAFKATSKGIPVDVRAVEIKGRSGRVSLRKVAEELALNGYVTPSGKHDSASAVASMLVE